MNVICINMPRSKGSESYVWVTFLSVSFITAVVTSLWAGKEKRQDVESERGGVWRNSHPTGLKSNWQKGSNGVTRTGSTEKWAQSTLAPFSRPHILYSRALAAASLLCPHRRHHKKPSTPQSPQNPSLFDLKRDKVRVYLLIVHRDSTLGLLLKPSGHMSTMGCLEETWKEKYNIWSTVYRTDSEV